MGSSDFGDAKVLAKRDYLLVRNGKRIDYSIAIAGARIASPNAFGMASSCIIYVSHEAPEGREIQGRDDMEALCHGLLAIEARLLGLSERGELLNVDGSPAEIGQFGLFFGVIGDHYREQLNPKEGAVE
jgi:hypothetical protein